MMSEPQAKKRCLETWIKLNKNTVYPLQHQLNNVRDVTERMLQMQFVDVKQCMRLVIKHGNRVLKRTDDVPATDENTPLQCISKIGMLLALPMHCLLSSCMHVMQIL
jgi:hypothetical protein